MPQASQTQHKEWRLRVAERRQEQSRTRILKAARELFASEGYASVTVEQIANAAGVAPATVYNRFGSKATIAAYLFKPAFEELQRLTQADIAAQLPLEQAVRTYFERLAHLALSDPLFVGAFLRGVFESGLLAGQPVSDLDPRRVVPLPAPLAAIFRAGIQRREIPPAIEADHVAALALGAFMVALSRGDEPVSAAQMITGLFLYGICRPLSTSAS
jgi:AcrR family transcriptional regulator